MKLFIYSIILALFMESICFTLFPALMRRCMLEVLKQSESDMRMAGATGMVIAIILTLVTRLL